MSEVWIYFCIGSSMDPNPLKSVSVENLPHSLHQDTLEVFRPSW